MKKDTVVCGLLVALGSIVLSAVVVAGFMLFLALSPVDNLKFFILSFVDSYLHLFLQLLL